MLNYSSTKLKYRYQIPNFHKDTPYKFQPICLIVISIYYCFLFKNFKYIGYIIEWRALMAFTVKLLWSPSLEDSIRAAVSFGNAAITLSGVFYCSFYRTICECSIRNTPQNFCSHLTSIGLEIKRILYGERAIQTNWRELVSSSGKLKTRLGALKDSYFPHASLVDIVRLCTVS